MQSADTANVLAVPFSLVFQHRVELGPADLPNSAGQFVVLHYTSRIEIFQTYRIVLIDYLSRYLVKEVTSLVGNGFVQPGNNDALLVPIL